MRIGKHFLLCCLLALLYFFLARGASPAGVLVIFLFGFAIDLDHVASYQIVKGDLLKKGAPPLEKVLGYYSPDKPLRRSVNLLHFAETGLLLSFLFAGLGLLVPFLLGWLCHFAADFVFFLFERERKSPRENPLDKTLARYFLTYRLATRRELVST